MKMIHPLCAAALKLPVKERVSISVLKKSVIRVL
jgi:hypothetical protein